MSELTIAVLSEAWHHFGRFTAENEREVGLWVNRRCQAIRSGHAPLKTLAHPTLPRSFERSWYDPKEREPGSDDA